MERERENEMEPESGCCHVNRSYLPIKAHYFFLFGAFAGTIPFMQIVGKDLGLSATAVGLVYTAVPFCIFFAKPIFGCFADFFHNIKVSMVLLVVVSAAFFLGIIFIPPIASTEEQTYNVTNVTACDLGRQESQFLMDPWPNSSFQGTVVIETMCRFTSGCLSAELFGNLSITSYGPRNMSMEFTYSVVKNVTSFDLDCLKSNWSQLTCDKNATVAALSGGIYEKSSFWLYVVLAVVAGTCSATTFSLSDAACYEVLGQNSNVYGRQRVFATISWGLITFCTGYLNDIVTGDSRTNDYSAGFYVMVAFVVVDLLILFWMRMPKVNTSRNILKDVGVLFKSPNTILFVVTVYIIGSLTAVVSNFQFWYLQDLGASQTLLGVVVLVRSLVIEIPFFVLSGWFVNTFGHFNCLLIALAALAIKIGLYTLLVNPWVVLPIEIFHGLSYAVFYSAMVLYVVEYSPSGTEATMLGLLGGIFEGLGVATGSCLGGIGFDKIGGGRTFFAGSMIALVCLVLIAMIRCCLPKETKRANLSGLARTKFPNYGSGQAVTMSMDDTNNKWRLRERDPNDKTSFSSSFNGSFDKHKILSSNMIYEAGRIFSRKIKSGTDQALYTDITTKTGETSVAGKTSKVYDLVASQNAPSSDESYEMVKTSFSKASQEEYSSSNETAEPGPSAPSKAASETGRVLSAEIIPGADQTLVTKAVTKVRNFFSPKKIFGAQQTSEANKVIAAYKVATSEIAPGVASTSGETLTTDVVSANDKVASMTAAPDEMITTFVTFTKKKNIVRKETVQPTETSPDTTVVTLTDEKSDTPKVTSTKASEDLPSSVAPMSQKSVTVSPAAKTLFTTTETLPAAEISAVKKTVRTVVSPEIEKTVGTSTPKPVTQFSKITSSESPSLKLFFTAGEPITGTTTTKKTATSIASPTIEKSFTSSDASPTTSVTAIKNTVTSLMSPTIEKSSMLGEASPAISTSTVNKTVTSLLSPTIEKPVTLGEATPPTSISTVKKTVTSLLSPSNEKAFSSIEASPATSTSTVKKTSLTSPTIGKSLLNVEALPETSTSTVKTVASVTSPTLEKSSTARKAFLTSATSAVEKADSAVKSPAVEKTLTVIESFPAEGTSTIQETVTTLVSPTVEKTLTSGKGIFGKGTSGIQKTVTTTGTPKYLKSISLEGDLAGVGTTRTQRTLITAAAPSIEKSLSIGDDLADAGTWKTKKTITRALFPTVKKTLSIGDDMIDEGTTRIKKITTVTSPKTAEKTIVATGGDLVDTGAAAFKRTVTTVVSPTIERTFSSEGNLMDTFSKTRSPETFGSTTSAFTPEVKDLSFTYMTSTEGKPSIPVENVSSRESLVGGIASAVVSGAGAASSSLAAGAATSSSSLDRGISALASFGAGSVLDPSTSVAGEMSSSRASIPGSLLRPAASLAGGVLSSAASSARAVSTPNVMSMTRDASGDETPEKSSKKLPKYRRRFF